MHATQFKLTHRRALRSSSGRAVLCVLALAVVALPTQAQAQAEALVRTSTGKVVGRVRIADLEAQRAPATFVERSGSPGEMLDSGKVERSADRVRALITDVDTVRLRVGDQLVQQKAWAVDSTGYVIVDFVPLWGYPRRLTGDGGGRAVAVAPGVFSVTVRPMRIGRPRPTDPVDTVVVLVTPR